MATAPKFEASRTFARKLDKADPLRSFRQQFFIPTHAGKPVVYFTGNSLGLQPKSTANYIAQELKDWAQYGVEGHFQAKNPWFTYHHQFTAPLCDLLGAKPIEVVAMNQLTVNLNLLLISFYQPKGKKTKILLEKTAFPSDQYAAQQHLRLHGYAPEKHLLELPLAAGESTHRTADILAYLEKNKDNIALFLLGAVNYYSGQFFDLKAIAKCCKKNNIVFGTDLAHAMGNLPLQLHSWGVDFATWCSYKYLNSGPGGVSGIFVHERHAKSFDLPRLAGWWGNDEKTRFKMGPDFVPAKGAAGWQMSNAPVLSMAAHKAALDIFSAAGIDALRNKSIQLTGYLYWLLQKGIAEKQLPLAIITPEDPQKRGCQISIRTLKDGRKIFDHLTRHGIVADWREPDVIRVAPVPLYNTFEDVYHFSEVLFNFQ